MRRFASVLIVTLALACGFDGSSGPFIIGGGGSDVTKLRFVHASADSPNLELLTDGLSNLGEIGFGSSTPYIQTSAATVHLTLNSSLSVTPVIDTIVTLPESTLVTIVAQGPDSAITLQFLTDGRGSIDTSLVKVRVVHEAPSGGPLDVYITAPLADLNLATPVVAGITFGSVTAYSVLPSGSYQVRVTTGGTKTVVQDSGTLTLGTADVRTFMVLDAAGGGLPLESVLLRDAGT